MWYIKNIQTKPLENKPKKAHIKMRTLDWAQWYTPLIPALERQKQVEVAPLSLHSEAGSQKRKEKESFFFFPQYILFHERSSISACLIVLPKCYIACFYIDLVVR